MGLFEGLGLVARKTELSRRGFEETRLVAGVRPVTVRAPVHDGSVGGRQGSARGVGEVRVTAGAEAGRRRDEAHLGLRSRPGDFMALQAVFDAGMDRPSLQRLPVTGDAPRDHAGHQRGVLPGVRLPFRSCRRDEEQHGQGQNDSRETHHRP
jgi:hypothetical protein